MIIIKLDTQNDNLQQFDKVAEEFVEFQEQVYDKELRGCHNMHRVIEEGFDVIQATMQYLLNNLTDEEFKRHYNTHLEKLQKRNKKGEIKIDHYLAVCNEGCRGINSFNVSSS